MTKNEINKLSNGLYKVYWKPIDDLGILSSVRSEYSLAAIGDIDFDSGNKWICLTSWINPFNKDAGPYNSDIWEEIERVVLISIG